MVDTQARRRIGSVSSIFFFFVNILCEIYYIESRCGYSSCENSELYIHLGEYTVRDNVIEVFPLNYMVYKCISCIKRLA